MLSYENTHQGGPDGFEAIIGLAAGRKQSLCAVLGESAAGNLAAASERDSSGLMTGYDWIVGLAMRQEDPDHTNAIMRVAGLPDMHRPDDGK